MYASPPTTPTESGSDTEVDDTSEYEPPPAFGGSSRPGGDVREACEYAYFPIAGWISGSEGAFSKSSGYGFSSGGFAGGYTHGVCTGRLGRKPRRLGKLRPAVALAAPAGSASGAEVNDACEYESPPAFGGSSRRGGDAREACEHAPLPIAGWSSGSEGAFSESSRYDLSSGGFAGGYAHGVCTERLEQRPRRPGRHRPVAVLAAPAGPLRGPK